MSQRQSRIAPWVVVILLLCGAGLVGVVAVREWLAPEASARPASASAIAAPVEVGSVTRGRIELRRRFSGSVQASSLVTVAPRIAGRVTKLPVDIGDAVRRGDVIAELESDEFEQLVAQARADLAVAKAELAEAVSAAAISTRELERAEALHGDRMIADSELDATRARHLANDAAVEVAKAQIMRAEAALASAEIRLSETSIVAAWDAGDATRVVAERYVEEGDTVQPGRAMLSIVELDPIEVVIFATQRDYAALERGQRVTLTTEAFPGRAWEGAVSRVAPIFREGSRQARIEVEVENADEALKPGMFVRAEAVLDAADDATIVPQAALVERDGQTSVFVVSDDGTTARVVPVRVGIRDAGRAQVVGSGVRGRVVTLGQQLLDDGSAIVIPSDEVAGDTTGSPGGVAGSGAAGDA